MVGYIAVILAVYASFFLCVGLSIGAFGVGRYARGFASFAIVDAVFLSSGAVLSGMFGGVSWHCVCSHWFLVGIGISLIGYSAVEWFVCGGMGVEVRVDWFFRGAVVGVVV